MVTSILLLLVWILNLLSGFGTELNRIGRRFEMVRGIGILTKWDLGFFLVCLGRGEHKLLCLSCKWICKLGPSKGCRVGLLLWVRF